MSSATSGSLVEIRGDIWRVIAIEHDQGEDCLICRGVEGISRGQEARFFSGYETITQVDPSRITLKPDLSPGFEDTKLYLEAAFRGSPAAGVEPTLLGGAAIDDLAFQHVPVQRALSMPRARLLIADDVGLGKTLEAGLVASELIARDRAKRILVVTTRAMLAQFQKEFWTRFSIPLARLDGSAIKRMRNRIPAHYNVFDQFERSIVSIDTLKRDLGIRTALENSYWDLVIIDEAHNAAVRKSSSTGSSLRAKLAKLLSRKADNLLLLTATPHDGSKESFASLIQMLDPTRVPNPETVSREDIEDLVIRRFRTTKEVKQALDLKVQPRQLKAQKFPISPAEDEAYRMIADLKLEMDNEQGPGKASQLFRTTLAKAVFSSPMACLETVENRIKRIGNTGKGSQADSVALGALRDQLASIDASNFAKYQNLLEYLKVTRWSPRDKRDRIVIFSERLKTLSWLEERLKRDLGLDDDAVGRVDGAAAESDERMQTLLEDFGQEPAKIRILLASDMASEGLNLHFQCCRLIHFDLPWSLLRFQQRNGRIDRYGQDRQPMITYFVGESSHERVRDMWVLDRLVAKDEAAQEGVGDPAVFLGQGDVEGEEAVVAEAVAKGVGGDAFEAQMDRNLEAATNDDPDRLDLDALLFGEYEGGDNATLSNPATTSTPKRPSLFKDDFEYVEKALLRFSRDGDVSQLLSSVPKVDRTARSVRFDLPKSMKSTDSFGYASKNEVDDRFMPVEALKGQEIALTDDRQTINVAIDRARFDERTWPEIQYFWQVHPITEWLGDAADQLFARREVPLISLPGRLARDELAFLMTGSIANKRGTALVDAWGVVRVQVHDTLRRDVSSIEDVASFFDDIGFVGDTANRHTATIGTVADSVVPAVEKFQDFLVEEQRQKIAELEAMKDAQRKRLNGFRARFDDQLELKFGPKVEMRQSLADRRRQSQRSRRSMEIEEMFTDWEEWFEQTSTLTLDRSPFVDIKAVFQG